MAIYKGRAMNKSILICLYVLLLSYATHSQVSGDFSVALSYGIPLDQFEEIGKGERQFLGTLCQGYTAAGFVEKATGSFSVQPLFHYGFERIKLSTGLAYNLYGYENYGNLDSILKYRVCDNPIIGLTEIRHTISIPLGLQFRPWDVLQLGVIYHVPFVTIVNIDYNFHDGQVWESTFNEWYYSISSMTFPNHILEFNSNIKLYKRIGLYLGYKINSLRRLNHFHLGLNISVL